MQIKKDFFSQKLSKLKKHSFRPAARMPPKGTIKVGAGLKTREANEEESSAEYRGGCPKNGTKMDDEELSQRCDKNG